MNILRCIYCKETKIVDHSYLWYTATRSSQQKDADLEKQMQKEAVDWTKIDKPIYPITGSLSIYPCLCPTCTKENSNVLYAYSRKQFDDGKDTWYWPAISEYRRDYDKKYLEYKKDMQRIKEPI